MNCLEFKLPGVASDLTLPRVGELRIPLLFNESVTIKNNKIYIRMTASVATSIASVYGFTTFYEDAACTIRIGKTANIYNTYIYAIVDQEDELVIKDPSKITRFSEDQGGQGFITSIGVAQNTKSYVYTIFDLANLNFIDNLLVFNNASGITRGDLIHLNKHTNLEVFLIANKEENYQTTGDIATFNRFAPKLTSLGIYNSSISGSINNLTSQFPALRYFMFGNRKYYSDSEFGYINNTLISGDPHIFAPRATHPEFFGVYFNMPLLTISAINLTKNIVYVRCGIPSISFDLNNLSNSQRVFRFDKSASYTGGTTKRFTQLDSLIHVGGGITSNQIDDLLIAISSSTFLPAGSGVITIRGTRTSASDSAVLALTQAGKTVTVSPTATT